MGQQNSADLSFISSNEALGYIQGLQTQVQTPKNNYMNSLPHTPDEMKTILASLLEFNPYFRSSAREAIKHPIFDDIRILNNEKHAPSKLNLSVDTDEAFNYDEGKSHTFTKDDYLKILYKEVLQVHAIREFSLKQAKQF